MERGVYIVGEDPVTRAIIVKIINTYAPEAHIIQSVPARGSEIKAKVIALNQLAHSAPVILLADLDLEPCAPIARAKLLDGILEPAPGFIINIAIDEAEAWLFADRNGFADYFGVPITIIPESSPQKFQGNTAILEVNAPIKSSYYLTHHLISFSSKTILKAQLYSEKSCKGKEYNSAVVPFIEQKWDIESARHNSDSLNRMILRVQRLFDNDSPLD